MSKFVKYRSKKAGLPPGSLIHLSSIVADKVKHSATDYNKEQLKERPEASLSECLQFLDSPTNTWIHTTGISDPEVVANIGKHFGLHPLVLEDILNASQRSKLDDYKENIYIVTRMLKWNQDKGEIQDEQVSIILGKNYLLSFVETESNIFDPVRVRLRNLNSRMRQMSTDYLCYGLIDAIVDSYFQILEHFDEDLERLETDLVNHVDRKVLFRIQHTKKEISLLRRTVWPMREVVSVFRRIETSLIHDSTKLYMHDVYDHTIQAIETIDSFRDLSSGMLDIYLSNMSNRLNEVMKLLTIIATIFVPLTFITSVYGMNFEYMPELKNPYGYHGVLLFMAFVASMMILYFRRKKWL